MATADQFKTFIPMQLLVISNQKCSADTYVYNSIRIEKDMGKLLSRLILWGQAFSNSKPCLLERCAFKAKRSECYCFAAASGICMKSLTFTLGEPALDIVSLQ